MDVSLSEAFLEDYSELNHNLKNKCRAMISAFKKIEASSLRENALPGWRMHKLESSPFVSFSIDMNFRILAKVDNKRLSLFRVIKHDLADASRINKNDNLPVSLEVSSNLFRPHDLYGALVALGISPEDLATFHGVETEDDLLNALVQANETVARYALELYETSGVIVPRTKHKFLVDDADLEQILENPFTKWEIYLHPSQEYLVNLSPESRVIVSGSAGTGKTVCGWYRLKKLAENGLKVGFVVPDNRILEVSREKLQELTESIKTETYFLVPNSVKQIIELANVVDHIIVDEGQEFSPTWLNLLSDFLATSKVGLTFFYDMNQLGGQYELGDSKRFQERIQNFLPALKRIPQSQFLDLFINYRNSREISKYYFEILNQHLPNPIRSEIPIFSSGEVVTIEAPNFESVTPILEDVIKKLLKDYLPREIVILFTSGKLEQYLPKLIKAGCLVSGELTSENKITVTAARNFRGHERKVTIVCRDKNDRVDSKVGRAINFYIGLSRARDLLIIIHYD